MAEACEVRLLRPASVLQALASHLDAVGEGCRHEAPPDRRVGHAGALVTGKGTALGDQSRRPTAMNPEYVLTKSTYHSLSHPIGVPLRVTGRPSASLLK